MNVLFVPRPDWKNAFGGDAIQMNATAKELRALGIAVDIARPEESSLDRYDVIHLWTSLQLPADLARDVEAVQSARPRGKVVLSPVWAPGHVLSWMFAARSWLFGRHRDLGAMTPSSAREDLTKIAERAITFRQGLRQIGPFQGESQMIAMRRTLEMVDMILPNSWMELQAIHHYVGVVCDFHVVPNAVDAKMFLEPPAAALPQELQGIGFAMMSARFDGRKQQDFALLALKELDIPLVFVGHVVNEETFNNFRALGSTRRAPVYYRGRMEQSELRSLYAAARVHFMPSIYESPGLSNIEAALLECSIVTGALSFEAEYFREEGYYCDPCDVWSIARAVEKAFGEYETAGERRRLLRQRILDSFTWQHAAGETASAYERVSTA